MVKRFSIILFILALVGCSSDQNTSPKIQYKEVVRTVEVKVPVVVKADPPPTRELPKLPTSSISKASSPKEVSQAYIESLSILIREVNWYRSILYKAD